MKKIIIVAPVSKSLINFRGDLIKDMKNKGHNVITASPALSEKHTDIFQQLKIDNMPINFQRNRLNPFYDLVTLIKLFKIFWEQSPDIILSYTLKPVIWGGLAARFFKTNFYALITGTGFVFYGVSIKRKLLRAFVTLLFKLSLRNSKGVIFQNIDDLNLFVSKGIVPRSKTHLVNGSGVNIKKFDLTNIPKGIINFLCIARLKGDKGIRQYAAAAKIIKKKFPNTVFNLVGPEETSPDAISSKEVNSWSDYIDYKGEVSDVRSLIKNSHVYVLPSYHEGLPRSTLEAMSMGRPIITTEAFGCKETVKEGVNGFKVPIANVEALAEKMIWFIENSNQIESMGIESRRMVEEKFDVRKVNTIMLDIMNL